MQDEAGDRTPSESTARHDVYDPIISDLVSAIERVKASVRLIESAIATDSSFDNPEPTTAFVVLDDLTPFYTRMAAALSVCKSGLSMAVHLLTDAKTLRAASEAPAGYVGHCRGTIDRSEPPSDLLSAG